MEELLKIISDTITEGAFAYISNKKVVKYVQKIFDKIMSDDEDVTIEEFLKMYDMRFYNFNNKRSDIKFMKKNDFNGVYILYNKTKKFIIVCIVRK